MDIKIIQKLPFAPPFFRQHIVDNFCEKTIVPQKSVPTPSFASRYANKEGRTFPQAIAHRGYGKTYTENSIKAFEDAVNVGAHALETDVHLSKDGTVVLSHDADLKRCFGVDKLIADCDWSYLETLRTVREPQQPLAKLSDLLERFQAPKWAKLWLVVDIKFDDDSEKLMSRLAKVFEAVDPGDGSQWKDKVVLGFWAGKFLPLCNKYFPEYPIMNIGFSPPYSRQFFPVSGCGFSMLNLSLVTPFGRRFIKNAHDRNHQVYSWVVNDDKNMDWCIRQGLDGVVTDNVPKFLETCISFDQAATPPSWSRKTLVGYLIFGFWTLVFDFVLRIRGGFRIVLRNETDKTK